MKTTFLLHGGMLSVSSPSNDSFFAEFARNLNDGDKVLFVGFARRDEQERLDIYERDKGYILSQTDRRVDVVCATYADFIEQAQSARAIFITGGETGALVKDVEKFPEFVDSIRGKVVAGTSAGAYLFAKYYFSSERGVCEGLDVVPIKIIGHYGNSDFKGTEDSLKLLQGHGEELETVVLNECEWTKTEIDL